jgi:CheY-like chemotaxis protein
MMFSRGEELARAPVDVAHVLESAVRMAAHELRARATVHRTYGDVPLVDANEARLGQVFLNLVLNAAQAIPAGDPERNHIRLATSTDERGRVVVSIADTGCGIPPELRSRVFVPFFTTKAVGGSGLGLSIAQRIVADLGGEIDLTSEVGRGTELRVTLPACAGAEPPGAPPQIVRPEAAVHPRPPLARPRVLVIDDEPMLTSALRSLLADTHDVEVQNDALAARDAFAAGARYDAVLCDLMMPRLSGIQLHGALREIAPDQARRMILMTGGALTPESRDFLATSGVAWIEKPFQLEDLFRALAAITGRS